MDMLFAYNLLPNLFRRLGFLKRFLREHIDWGRYFFQEKKERSFDQKEDPLDCCF